MTVRKRCADIVYALSSSLLLILAFSGSAIGQEKITYLLPAPGFLPAFAPFQIARHKGYYKKAGLDVEFQVGRGGVDVAKQVGAGNATIGGAVGDTSIIVRPNGVPVRTIALLGGHALAQIIVRKDAGIKSPADLKGKTVAVISYQDNTYYSLLAALSRFGIGKADIDAQAVGAAGVVQLMIANKAPAIAGVPEWAVSVESAGVPIEMFSVERYFPGMAQAILASDETVRKNPAAVRAFVQATLEAIREIMSDPAAATRVYLDAVPQHKRNAAEIEKTLRLYAELVYPGQAKLGLIDPARVAAVQDFYYQAGIISTKTDVNELYSNQFVQ